MDKNVALGTAVVIGGALALQAPLNSILGRHVGGLPATTLTARSASRSRRPVSRVSRSSHSAPGWPWIVSASLSRARVLARG